MIARRRCTWALLGLAAVGTSSAAWSAQDDAAASQPEASGELSEVVVSAQKPTRKIAEMIPWLRRLPGQYTFSGFLDVGAQGRVEDRHAVGGGGLCVGFGVAPGVQCEIDLRATQPRPAVGGAPFTSFAGLSPAMILYGLDPDALGIHYMQVDNRGAAEGAVGYVYGDTAVFRAPCADMPAGCVRVTRITAEPEADVINVQVDTEVDFAITTRLRFQMKRVAAARDEKVDP